MKRNLGVTFVELMVLIGIIIILTGIALPAFQFFQKGSALNEEAEQIINTLRLAQNKTLASEETSQWGIYFTTSTSPHQYILFKGEDFASRATSSDEVYQLSGQIELYEVNLAGGAEVVFDRVTGVTDQPGSVSLRLKADITQTKTIYISNAGKVGLATPSVPSDANRIKDSRHVHFDYSRLISTSTEKLVLTFDSSVTQDIIIADFLKEGQLIWENEVDVGGSLQRLKIHTHRLNDPDTQFSIHRDRRYNDKSLEIDISGDPGISPDLISYSADGLTTATGTSVYVGEPDWQ